jgi:hypothetical protein
MGILGPLIERMLLGLAAGAALHAHGGARLGAGFEGWSGPRSTWRIGCRWLPNKPWRAAKRHSGVRAIRRAAKARRNRAR